MSKRSIGHRGLNPSARLEESVGVRLSSEGLGKRSDFWIFHIGERVLTIPLLGKVN